ncbi:MAG TPA: exodeoxyribonuclease V subunit alpha, partial [Nocardioides sp.]
MSEVFEPVDAYDARFALGAAGRGDGLLAAANAAAVVTAADVHVARNLGVLGGEGDERVLLALALTGRAVRGGSVCLDLATTEALAADTGLAWPAPGEWRG